MTTWADTWSGLLDVGDPADGAVVDTALDNGRTVINGNIDNSNIAASAGIAVTKLDTGVITHWLGASTSLKVICGTKTVTLDDTGALGSGKNTVDFNTDADTYGSGAATDFTSTPIVVTSPTMTIDGDTPLRYVTGVASVTTAGFTLVCSTSDITSSTAAVVCYWIAIGT